ncbi:MAG TPA: GIY-YIG nuclease family protein [Flavobacterium sp.]|nr:GIY-YIG nuclease family protein [Flavobacterium sp.]
MDIYNKNFYWLKTNDNHENWFVIAYDEYLAEKFFVNMEGYDLEDVEATEICEVIFEDCDENEYFPSNEMLIKNGFEIIKLDEPMIVWKDGKKYCQGDIVHCIISEKSKNKLGLYIIHTNNSNLFKIGITKNINQRIKQFETGNPFEFTLYEFFETESCRKLEKIIHKKLEKNRYRKEWFKLNEEELTEICNFARNYIGLPPYLEEFNCPISDFLTIPEQNDIDKINGVNDLPF